MTTPRDYEIVVFGATGYTGKLTAEHITKALPTDLRWALAGRSASKLEAVAAECKALNPDRIPPAIEICSLNAEDLDALAKKTTVLIATIGPYSLYGEHAFKACAENGTHYLDITGEIPYVAKMIKKYESTAKASGAIMIPQIGVDSAPPDLVTYELVKMIKERFSAPTAEVVVSVHDIKAQASGDTLNTVFTLLDTFSLKELSTSLAPYAISPIPGPKAPSPSLFSKIFGVRTVRDLGLLTTAINGRNDAPIIWRSWGLLNYGPKFSFKQMMKTRNYLTGILFHFAFIIGATLIAIPFVRRIVKKFVYQPGEGPTKEESRNDHFEYRGIAKPDVEMPNPSRAFCKLTFKGSMYVFTGISVAEAAMSLLRDEHKLSGGIYTPACLGQMFINRLETAGCKFEKKFFDN